MMRTAPQWMVRHEERHVVIMADLAFVGLTVLFFAIAAA
jgi:hypothetical protein